MTIFKGSGVALVTPFNEDLTVNYEKMAELIEFQISNGTDALIICGTTGEASTLTDDEQIECVRFAVEVTKKRIPVIAGAGSNHTEHGCELTKRSYDAGADAVLLVTPYYNKTTQKGLVQHYSYIASKVDIPIILYNVPSRTGMNIAPKTAHQLSSIENVVGIKEASGNISQIAEIAALCGDKLPIYSGEDSQNIPILSLGGIGAISVAANIIPKDLSLSLHSYLNGHVETGKNMQLKMIELIQGLFIETNPIPVKEAMNIMGMNVGLCRMPLTTMEPSSIEFLKKAMQNYGLIKG